MVIELKESVLSKRVHPDLLSAEGLIYKPSGLILQNLKIEGERDDYGAAEFSINHHSVKFRVGKITPTKIGQFVFPKAVLCEKGIVSCNGKEGKRAMRIYLLGIELKILKLRKRKPGNYNILLNSLKISLIFHA